MIKTIIKRELLNYLKNPIYYIGAILVFIGVYTSVSPYLGIHYFTDESEIKTLETYSELADAEIIDGYIPATKEDQFAMGLDNIKKVLIEEFQRSESEVNESIEKIKERKMSIPDVSAYMEENYSLPGGDTFFYHSTEMKKATVEEANNYIKHALEQQTYSSYFSRKYADFLSLMIVFYAILMLAFLYIRDSKKDIYELLHTRPVKAWQYITGKILGGMTALGLAVTVITAIFDVLVILHGKRAGFPVSVWDLWIVVLLYILPNLLMIASVYTGVAILFKNPLPAIPALLLYFVYSNMGSVLEDGTILYPKLAILVRFQSIFFDTVIPPQAVVNQIFLVGCTIVIILFSSLVWKRRRVY